MSNNGCSFGRPCSIVTLISLSVAQFVFSRSLSKSLPSTSLRLSPTICVAGNCLNNVALTPCEMKSHPTLPVSESNYNAAAISLHGSVKISLSVQPVLKPRSSHSHHFVTHPQRGIPLHRHPLACA